MAFSAPSWASLFLPSSHQDDPSLIIVEVLRTRLWPVSGWGCPGPCPSIERRNPDRLFVLWWGRARERRGGGAASAQASQSERTLQRRDGRESSGIRRRLAHPAVPQDRPPLGCRSLA